MGEFGDWFRELRLGRGLGSAALSRRAAMNRAYVSDLERGKAFPRPDTITALADALELTGPDREEFIRRALAAGKPEFVGQAVARPILGLTIWDTLPRMLFDRREPYGPEELAFLDDAYGDGVPAIASMLAWRRLSSTRLTRPAAESIRSLAHDVFHDHVRKDEVYNARVGPPGKVAPEESRRRAAAKVHWIIGPAYRSILFSRQASERLVSKVESWRYSPSYREDFEISIDLATPVNDVTSCEGPYPCGIFRAVYDLMLSREIWIRLGLSELLDVAAPAIDNPVEAEAELLAPGAIDEAVAAAADKDQAVDVLIAMENLRFALRAYVIPELGPLIAGPLAPLLDRLTRVERVLARGHGEEWDLYKDPTAAIAAETERLLAARGTKH